MRRRRKLTVDAPCPKCHGFLAEDRVQVGYDETQFLLMSKFQRSDVRVAPTNQEPIFSYEYTCVNCGWRGWNQ